MLTVSAMGMVDRWRQSNPAPSVARRLLQEIRMHAPPGPKQVWTSEIGRRFCGFAGFVTQTPHRPRRRAEGRENVKVPELGVMPSKAQHARKRDRWSVTSNCPLTIVICFLTQGQVTGRNINLARAHTIPHQPRLAWSKEHASFRNSPQFFAAPMLVFKFQHSPD